MKQTKSTQPKTKPLHDALLAWDRAHVAHNADITKRGRALLDVKRLKLLLSQKQAYIKLHEQFNKWLRL